MAVLFWCTVSIAGDKDIQQLPDEIYTDLEYIFSVIVNDGEIDTEKISGIVDFVRSAPAGTSYSLATREGSQGAFHAFDINSQLSDVIGYALNPDIPPYMTMPSSLQNHHWLTPETARELRSLIAGGDAIESMQVFRGQENETITPDIHTGGYYSYDQDRFLLFFPDSSGPILISATLQNNISEIGRKGCVVGDDSNWDYLYLEKTGLTKAGLGWVDTFMYKASAVAVYVSDTTSGNIHAGSFKWLDAGWSQINMVKSHHILKGIKRFANDFKNILESPNLPEVQEITNRYQELQAMKKQELRLLVAPYLETLKQSEKIEDCSKAFVSLVSSGKYLEQMDNQELIRILLLEYLKGQLEESGYESVGFHTAPVNSVSIDS